MNKLSTAGRDEDDWGVKPDKGLELVLPRSEDNALQEAFQEREVIRNDYKSLRPYPDRQLELALKHLRK
jgi:hypothetical protein